MTRAQMRSEVRHMMFFDLLMGWQLDKYSDAGASYTKRPEDKLRRQRAHAARKVNQRQHRRAPWVL